MSEALPRIVQIVVGQENERRRRGLERLLEHYDCKSALEGLAHNLGITFSLDDPLLEAASWSLVGPRLAESNSVFLNRKRGAPRKPLNSTDTERARIVDRVKAAAFEADDFRLSDAEIIDAIRERGHHLFPITVTPASLANSVSKGRARLQRSAGARTS